MKAVQSDVQSLYDSIYKDGVVGIPDALPVRWADQLDIDLKREFMAAMSVEKGTAPRGWNRFYFEPYAERLKGFVDLAMHPAVAELARQMLGDNYLIIEVGSDIPLPGAINQPWHRDFRMPKIAWEDRRITSIAVNASSVDVTPDMGPFQYVPGTHFDEGLDFDGGMFPPESHYPEYESRVQSRLAKRGSISIRSGLMIHRGSKSSNRSKMRPVLILGIVAPLDPSRDPNEAITHSLKVSQQFIDSLPYELARHLRYEVVAQTEQELPPYYTEHDFEGLKMSEMI